MNKIKTVLFVIGCLVFITACQENPRVDRGSEDVTNAPSKEVVAEDIPSVEVELMDREGVSVGMAFLKELDKGVEIVVEASHLPEGLHGFHVHENGVCDTPTFETAGGHFNPTDKEHGFDNPKGPHAGDVHNLDVQADGSVQQTFYNEAVTLKQGKANSLMHEAGTSLIIHADPDDYVSQPAGNAGDRIACGVIYPPK